MGTFITTSDLAPFAEIDDVKAEAMIADAEALALVAAPCLSGDSLTGEQRNAVRAILRTAILRWNDAGSGALTQEGAGPFQVSYDTRQRRYGGLTDSESSRLRAICSAGDRRVFTVSTRVTATSRHLPWCSLFFAGGYCSCGADIAGEPIYELGSL